MVTIERVIRSEQKGRIIYQGNLLSHHADALSTIPLYNHPDGTGYQRPFDSARALSYAEYLQQDDACLTPIVLNADGKWTFEAYDESNPDFGKLVCQGPARVIDGQHRLGGIDKYHRQLLNEEPLPVPFLAFHVLYPEEEVSIFDTINTNQVGLTKSLLVYLKRDKEEYARIAIDLAERNDSPFYNLVVVVTKKTTDRPFTLDHLKRACEMMIEGTPLAELSLEKKRIAVMVYFREISRVFEEAWHSKTAFKLRSVMGLMSCAMVGRSILEAAWQPDKEWIDEGEVKRLVWKMHTFDWSRTGQIRYASGIPGQRYVSQVLTYMVFGVPVKTREPVPRPKFTIEGQVG
ncbi:DGQHR domain-containing protein [Effusibacillus consociatus]|uniref:DGQHR domain-containing protein n=1 Tax=Effusibacillus consociatus TaxID=1117041 RepID=A0ABV9PZY2_9BACL